MSKDIKTSIRNYKHGTFPFYSSFIKVETDLMCMRRNFSFCVLSPNEVSKTEKKKYLQVHILPLFLHLCGNRKVCSWLRDVSRRFFLHSNACFLDGGWMGCSERSVACVPYPAVPCTFPQHAALIHPGQWVRSRRCHCLLFVHFSFFLSVMVLEKAARGSDSV